MKFIDDAKAVVYTERDGVFYVKVSMRELGLYVSGITVRKSPTYGGWWVQMPYYQDFRSKRTKRYIEFDQESPLRIPIEQLCIEAVEAHKHSSARGYTGNLDVEQD